MAGEREDARRNRERIVEVARTVVREQGTQASLRDIARRAEVGLGTLYRHFPNRDALLETLMRRRFEHLTARAAALAGQGEPDALPRWLIEYAYGTGVYRQLPETVMATLADEASPLHASCSAMRDAVAGLLTTAQADGAVRGDLTAEELFALVTAVGWIAEQAPTLEGRRERLLALILEGLRAPGR